MLLSNNTAGTQAQFGLEKTVKLLAEAGFDAVDLSLGAVSKEEGNALNGAGYEKEALKIKKLGDDLGIVFNQAHATFPTSYNEEERTKKAIDTVKREIEIAAVCGVKNIIVHPQQHLCYLEGNNKELIRNMNVEFYGELVPFAEVLGINIATENMWQRSKFDQHIVEGPCASPEEFCEYIDIQKSSHMVGCLDIGHAALVGRRAEDMVYALGKDRLKALHVHDNDGKQDLHILPRMPWFHAINWDAVLKALADIDYDGDFTFEVDYMNKCLNEYTAPSFFKYSHDLGRDMIRQLESYKKAK